MRKHGDYMIVQAILQGDIERYSELIDKYQDWVFTIVAKRLPRSEVLTIAHEVFVQAYKSLSSYSGKAPWKNWLTRIALRSCYAYWREKDLERRRYVSMHDSSDDKKELELKLSSPQTGDADWKLKQSDTKALLQYVLDELNAEEKTLIESIYFDELPLKDVAAAMGWSLVKTKVKAFRTRKKMREILASMGEFA